MHRSGTSVVLSCPTHAHGSGHLPRPAGPPWRSLAGAGRRLAGGSKSRCSPRPLHAELSSILVGRDAAPTNEQDPRLEQSRVPSPRLRWWPIAGRCTRGPSSRRKSPRGIQHTIAGTPCKDCLGICCRVKEVGRCTVPAYDSATRQAWTRRPATTAGRGVLAGVVRGQMQAAPHVHGVGREGRDEHLPGQLGANCQSPELDCWPAPSGGGKGAMS